jgi:hypothetical protein
MTDDAQQQASSGALIEISSSPIGSQKELKWTLEFPAAKKQTSSSLFLSWQ